MLIKRKGRLLTIGMMVLVLAGCHNVPLYRYDMFEKPPGDKEYSANYVLGWKDGCESGAQASANHLYRFVYKFKQDWRMLSDAQYSIGWEDSYNYCRKYVLAHNLYYMRE